MSLVSNFKRKSLTGGFLFISLLLMIGNVACTLSPSTQISIREEAPEIIHAPIAYESAFLAWEEGISAFRMGDFGKAMAIFEVLSEQTEDERLSQKALFILAATRLITAKNPREFNQAMAVWRCWSQTIPIDPEGEDPRLLTTFLERLTPPGAPVQKLEVPKIRKPAPAKPVPNSSGATAEISIYKNLFQDREREVERLKTRLESREREVRRLKHQLQSLEEIHQKFQEKKQEVR